MAASISSTTEFAFVTTSVLPDAETVPPLDLSGTTQTIASLSDISGNGGVVTNSAGTSVTLTFSSAATNTFTGAIRGSLALVKSGTGTQSLNGANSYSGNTTVNAGTLAFGQATLPTNGIVTVTNGAVLGLNFTGTNRVAALVLNGTNQLPGTYNTANSAPYLAGLGSLLIGTPIATNPTNILFSVSGTSLTLSWPPSHLGWVLQQQTNSLSTGLSTNWVDVAGSASLTATNITINPATPTVFYRLRNP